MDIIQKFNFCAYEQSPDRILHAAVSEQAASATVLDWLESTGRIPEQRACAAVPTSGCHQQHVGLDAPVENTFMVMRRLRNTSSHHTYTCAYIHMLNHTANITATCSWGPNVKLSANIHIRVSSQSFKILCRTVNQEHSILATFFIILTVIQIIKNCSEKYFN